MCVLPAAVDLGRLDVVVGVTRAVTWQAVTSTYIESDVQCGADDLRQYGYSRDKRGDCRQVVIALIVTLEGFPLSYEVLSGNTADATTLVDVCIPTTDGRELVLPRYTQPEAEHRMLLEQLRVTLPEQPPPKITAREVQTAPPVAAL